MEVHTPFLLDELPFGEDIARSSCVTFGLNYNLLMQFWGYEEATTPKELECGWLLVFLLKILVNDGRGGYQSLGWEMKSLSSQFLEPGKKFSPHFGGNLSLLGEFGHLLFLKKVEVVVNLKLLLHKFEALNDGRNKGRRLCGFKIDTFQHLVVE